MRNLIVTIILFFITKAFVQAQDSVLFHINGKEIHQSEFLYTYNKNQLIHKLNNETNNEFIDLYINLKLKVEEAKSLGLDTTTSFKNQLKKYRKQAAEQYLTSPKIEEAILQEAYQHMQENIAVYYLFLKIPSPGTPSDTLSVYNKAMKIRQKSLEGDDFKDLIQTYSEDSNVQQDKGYLGYITAFSTPYEFEKTIYNLKEGEISMPFRFFDGYYLAKVVDKRNDIGKYKSAHILKMVTPRASKNTKAEAKKAIFDIYKQLQAGADFSTLAKQFSDDKPSAKKGGELPWFGSGVSIPIFEEALTHLSEGSYAPPFLTRFGWHIVKLLEKKPLAPYADCRAEITKKIAQDKRKNAAQDAKVEELKLKYNFTRNKTTYDFIYKLATQHFPLDSVFYAKLESSSKILFSINKKRYSICLFPEYLQLYHSKQNTPTVVDAIKDRLDKFESHCILTYEEKNLEKLHPEFKSLMKEYHDGILSFDVINQEVWRKRAKNPKELTYFFKKHKKQYRWTKKHFKGYAIECTNKKIAKAVKKKIKKLEADSAIKVINREFNTTNQQVRIKYGLFKEGENKVVDRYAFKHKEIKSDSILPYGIVYGKKLNYKPRSYEDVLIKMAPDFHQYIEKKWLKELKQKYPVKVNKELINKIIR